MQHAQLLLHLLPHSAPAVSQVAEWLGRRLADPYAFKYHTNDNDMPLPKFYQPAGMTDRYACDKQAYCSVLRPHLRVLQADVQLLPLPHCCCHRRDWALLREVRQDQLRGSGAAGGTAKLVQRPSPWAAPQPDNAARDTPEAAAATGPASGATSAAAAAEEPAEAVVLTMGSEPGLAVAAAGDFDDEAMEEDDEEEQEQQEQAQMQQAPTQPADPGSGADGAGTSAPPAGEGATGAKARPVSSALPLHARHARSSTRTR